MIRIDTDTPSPTAQSPRSRRPSGVIYARWHRSKGLPKKPRRRRQPQLFFLTPWRVRGPLRHAPRRPLQRAAGEAAVIIVGLDEFPAFEHATGSKKTAAAATVALVSWAN